MSAMSDLAFSGTLPTSGMFNALPLETSGLTPNTTSPALHALGTLTTGFSLATIVAALVTARRALS